jgi:hypothetical protein
MYLAVCTLVARLRRLILGEHELLCTFTATTATTPLTWPDGRIEARA